MSNFNLNGPEGVYVGLDALKLDAGSWKVQFDGGKPQSPVIDYGHGADGTVIWLRFSVSEGGATVVLQGDWDLSTNTQTLKKGSSVATLQAVTQKPFNGCPFIDPGNDGAKGSHVWFRYGVASAGADKTKEYTFRTPLHVDLGRVGDLLKLLGVLGA